MEGVARALTKGGGGGAQSEDRQRKIDMMRVSLNQITTHNGMLEKELEKVKERNTKVRRPAPPRGVSHTAESRLAQHPQAPFGRSGG